jgi:hypothetical protein
MYLAAVSTETGWCRCDSTTGAVVSPLHCSGSTNSRDPGGPRPVLAVAAAAAVGLLCFWVCLCLCLCITVVAGGCAGAGHGCEGAPVGVDQVSQYLDAAGSGCS